MLPNALPVTAPRPTQSRHLCPVFGRFISVDWGNDPGRMATLPAVSGVNFRKAFFTSVSGTAVQHAGGVEIYVQWNKRL